MSPGELSRLEAIALVLKCEAWIEELDIRSLANALGLTDCMAELMTMDEVKDSLAVRLSDLMRRAGMTEVEIEKRFET